jgi:hypothetical protein
VKIACSEGLLDAVGTPLGTVQALLGHPSSGVTREVYLHSIPANGRAALQKVRSFTDWTQMDPRCGTLENWKQANSMMGLRKIGRGERI